MKTSFVGSRSSWPRWVGLVVGKSVLPWRAGRNRFVSNAHGRRRCLTIEPKTRSRSRMRYPGADSQGKASVIWRAIHSAVGLFVTPIQTSSSAVEPNDDEAIEQAEGKRRHDEK